MQVVQTQSDIHTVISTTLIVKQAEIIGIY